MTFKQIAIGLFSILMVLQLVGLYNQFFKPSDVVYLDANKLLENYEGMKAARQDFQAKALQWQANIDTLKLEFEGEVKKYNATKASMSKKEKELNEELLRTKQKQLVDYQQGIQQKSQQEDQQMTERVLSEVNTFIEDYGKKKGYNIILGATQMGNLVYADEVLDITTELQEVLNASYIGI